MSMNDTINSSIHGIPKYINFDIQLNFCLLLPTIPFIYIIPTMVVMWKVFRGYLAQPSNLTKLTLDGHLFGLLMFYFVMNIAFFFADMLRFNIPSSGLITSWCASISPNRGFVLLIVIADYLNYCILVLPFLVSLIRMIILTFAYNHQKIRVFVMKWFILPVLFLVPLLSVSFMYPSIGYCRQLGPPFPLGALDIYYTRGFLGTFDRLTSIAFLLTTEIQNRSKSIKLSGNVGGNVILSAVTVIGHFEKNTCIDKDSQRLRAEKLFALCYISGVKLMYALNTMILVVPEGVVYRHI